MEISWGKLLKMSETPSDIPSDIPGSCGLTIYDYYDYRQMMDFANSNVYSII
jgi:hypothetical protein